MAERVGSVVVQVMGPVVDEFPEDKVPSLYSALTSTTPRLGKMRQT